MSMMIGHVYLQFFTQSVSHNILRFDTSVPNILYNEYRTILCASCCLTFCEEWVGVFDDEIVVKLVGW
jgi:hypothetical protein